ncbi:MAG: hypothetical protein R6U38_15050 [Desulfatiglandaceae bacterium]
MKCKDNKIQHNGIRMVPILHNRMEFALAVREAFEAFAPQHVAVEYPHTLREKILQGINRLPLLSVVYYQDGDGAFTYLLLEPTDGQVEAIRLALSTGAAVHFIDRDTQQYPLDFSPMPDPYTVKKIGHFKYCQAYLNTQQEDGNGSREDILREKTMAYHLQQLSKTGERVLFVCGLSHTKRILKMLDTPQTQVIGRQKREGIGLAHLHQDSSREVLTEMPYLTAQYEHYRRAGGDAPDRLLINQELLDAAKKRHQKKSREILSHGQLAVLNKFARNYALLTGNLVPSFYQLIVASRGAVDDNFAYEVWDKGCEYPWQTDHPGLPVLRLKGEDLFLDQKRIRFHRQLKTLRRRLVPVPVQQRPRERYPGEWREASSGDAICSYPPQDVVVEGYGQYLKKKALEIKTQENTRISPFTVSMKDGLDLRETIRDWGAKGRIYVREEQPFKGRVGSVVIIFDPDLPNAEGKEAFPWCTTWLGEHDQESDMAFYSTPSGEVMDGPGISRCQYGGFMLSYPPLRVYDIWKDPFFQSARNKPERLLMAALDYSLERHVVYVAPTPPSGWCQSMAARLGKRIIYLPIGTFSPVTLKKIRQFHVLEGHPVRAYAHRYIHT